MTVNDLGYGFERVIALAFQSAVERLLEHLAEAGFEVVCRIDVERLLQSQGVDTTRPYMIFGVMKPTYCVEALTAQPPLGLLIPCNIVVRERDEGVTELSVLDPRALSLLDRTHATSAVGQRAAADLKGVLGALGD